MSRVKQSESITLLKSTAFCSLFRAPWLPSVQPLLLITPGTLAARCTTFPPPYSMHLGGSPYSLSCSLFHAPCLFSVQPLLLIIPGTLAAFCTASPSPYAPWLNSEQERLDSEQDSGQLAVEGTVSRRGGTLSRRGWTLSRIGWPVSR